MQGEAHLVLNRLEACLHVKLPPQILPDAPIPGHTDSISACYTVELQPCRQAQFVQQTVLKPRWRQAKAWCAAMLIPMWICDIEKK